VGARLLARRYLPEVADGAVGVGRERRAVPVDWDGVVRDVVEEGVAGSERVGRNQASGLVIRGFDERRIALEQRRRRWGRARQYHLRESMRTGLEVAVRVGEDQRHVEHVGIDQLDAELLQGLQLHLSPVADVADLVALYAGAAVAAVIAVEDFPVG